MASSQNPKTDAVPARLFGILARNAPKGVILRRGPSKWVELILWDTANDTFERGQWFKGRIYERGCDLSPNGSYFLYFGSKYHLERWASEAAPQDETRLYQWTAISKPPYFTALAMWPYVEPLGALGGVFLNDHKAVIWSSPPTPIKGSVPDGFEVAAGFHDTEPYLPVVKHLSGWRIVQEYIWQHPPGKCVQPEVRRKDRPGAGFAILMEAGFYTYEYFLEDLTTKKKRAFPDVTWMDWDQQGRLVFTKEGKLFASPADELDPQLLADFTPDEIREVIAPDWAREW